MDGSDEQVNKRLHQEQEAEQENNKRTDRHKNENKRTKKEQEALGIKNKFQKG